MKRLGILTVACVIVLALSPTAASLTDTTPPTISNIWWSSNYLYPPGCPEPTALIVRADVTDPSGLAWVRLYYDTARTPYMAEMRLVSGNTYEATIGGFSDPEGMGSVVFKVRARDNAGNETDPAGPSDGSIALYDCSFSIPKLINYQGKLSDAAGVPVSGAHMLTFRLYDDQARLLWLETQRVNFTAGQFNVLLGNVVPLEPAYFSGSSFLEVEIDGEALAPRQRVTSVAYALRAEMAQTALTLGGQPPTAFAPATHDHFGAEWSGPGIGLRLAGGLEGIRAEGGETGGYFRAGDGGVGVDAEAGGGAHEVGVGVRGYAFRGVGVQGGSELGEGVVGGSANGTGVKGSSLTHVGVAGTSSSDYGGRFTGASGVYGSGSANDGYGGYFSGLRAGAYGEARGPAGGLGTGVGVLGKSGGGAGVRGESAGSGNGVEGSSYAGRGGSFSGATGVYGSGDARGGDFSGATGVCAAGSSGAGGEFSSASSYGIRVTSAGQDGIWVQQTTSNGVRVEDAASNGIYLRGNIGADGIRVNNAGGDGMHIGRADGDGVQVESAGDKFFRAGPESNPVFYVSPDGEVRSDVGFKTPAADFAEVMDVEGAAESYAPGDVLVISESKDRAVRRSTTPYSTAVIGVYSAAPGFAGGVSLQELSAGLAVAIVGIVPCKVSAENGPIGRGDLLTTAATPGHAMKATEARPGAILGKALGALDTGVGVILVLVTLQ